MPGRQRKYGSEVTGALKEIREASDQICSKRLKPFIPEMVRVRQAVHHMRQRMPFLLLGIDSDNGSEFINKCFYNYCRDEKITFTRSRSYKKNDSCHVEQKNGNVVRRFVGYERYASKASFEHLERMYDLVRLYVNFFQPTMKLISKTSHGAKVQKVYDTARTPYQRLLNSGAFSEAKRQELATTYHGLNPVSLLKQINNNLESLWKLAERPGTQQVNYPD